MRPPYVAPTDPHHHARQDAQRYGDLITTGEVERVTAALSAIQLHKPYYGIKTGPNVRARIKEGVLQEKNAAKSAILVAYYGKGQIFEHLSVEWSTDAAEERCRQILFSLLEAFKKGIWTNDRVREWEILVDCNDQPV